MASQAYTGKLPSHTGSGYRKSRKYIKRATSKLCRRQGKRYGEDAPVRVVTGWVD
jgi:hypothetical protein